MNLCNFNRVVGRECAVLFGVVVALWSVACSSDEGATDTGGASGSGWQPVTASSGGAGSEAGYGGTSGIGVIAGTGGGGGAESENTGAISGSAGAPAGISGGGMSGAGAGGESGKGSEQTGGVPSAGTSGAAGTAGSSGAAGTAGTSGSSGTSATGGSGGSDGCVAATAVANMKIGWNLGNSLDSVDASRSDSEVETAWGNPVVTPALIKAVAEAGFGVVRIPVTWIGRFGAAPDYNISATFMARVEEVVNYVLDEGMYAIINLHHDGAEGVSGQWISLVDNSGQVNASHTAQVLAQFKKMWAQIADRFQSYNDHLIYESMNEIKVGYGTPLQSYYEQVNALNKAFVDTVRAGGGNNPKRCLVVPGYNTNIDYTVAGFVAPADTSSGKLILSAHFYDPYTFAIEGSTHAWGAGNAGIDNWGQEDWVRSQVAKLKSNYIDKGLPMIWGEYGAVNQPGYENYRRYYIEYVTKATRDAGIVPIYWDNGSMGSGKDGFGLFNRSSCAVQYPTILQAMMRAVTSSYTLAEVAKP